MKRKEIVIAITVGLLATALVVLSLSKWSDPITATVVDAETGQPIEGVVVVADWRLKGGFEGGNPVGHLAVMEAVTDKAGVFHFPGWGPRLSLGILRDWEPELLFFKNGYPYLHMVNQRDSRWYSWQANSSVDGTRVKMERFRGTPSEYLDNIGHFGRVLDSYLFGDDGGCAWKRIPKLIATMDEQIKSLPGYVQGRFSAPHQHLADNEEYFQKIGCGSAKEFLTGITK